MKTKEDILRALFEKKKQALLQVQFAEIENGEVKREGERQRDRAEKGLLNQLEFQQRKIAESDLKLRDAKKDLIEIESEIEIQKSLPEKPKNIVTNPSYIQFADGTTGNKCIDIIRDSEATLKKLMTQKPSFDQEEFWKMEQRQFQSIVDEAIPEDIEQALYIDECRDYVKFCRQKVHELTEPQSETENTLYFFNIDYPNQLPYQNPDEREKNIIRNLRSRNKERFIEMLKMLNVKDIPDFLEKQVLCYIEAGGSENSWFKEVTRILFKNELMYLVLTDYERRDTVIKWINSKGFIYKSENTEAAIKTEFDSVTKESEENNVLKSTIEDWLEDFKTNMSQESYFNLVEALHKYFETGTFPDLTRPIKITGKINIKNFGWSLNQIYRSEKQSALSADYLNFAKENISIFSNVSYSIEDHRNTTLYKYFTTKPK